MTFIAVRCPHQKRREAPAFMPGRDRRWACWAQCPRAQQDPRSTRALNGRGNCREGSPGIHAGEDVPTPQATCPDCTQPSTHIHSDYRRTLTDLPWATTPVTLHLRVRRFWCATPSCGRQTFAERVPQIAPHYARATARLTALQTSTGLALGGTAGARHLARQGAAGSRNTLLRRVRRLPPPAASRPCAIGIDDCAKRKGHTYGTQN